MRSKLVAGVLCASIFGACAGGANTGQGGSTPAPQENRVEIGMTEYAFGMPATVTGGNVTLEFTNNGDLPHEAAFGSVEGDHDADDVVKALQSDKDSPWLEDLAGIPVLDSGATAAMTRDLEPGRYVFLCFFPVPGKRTVHADEGMAQIFDVEGTSDAPAPEPELTITVTEEGFEVPEVSAGTHTIELSNEGKRPHEFFIGSLEPGKSMKDVDEWFESGFETEKPAIFPGGLQSIPAGTSVIVEMTFEAGRTYLVQDFGNQLEETFEVR